mmetsp:Transcript_26189/g.49149  ORF Transcript_26189/g.49149 Transcript_26189/m.49149 type:complete len:240 (-) Transcript_26189:218-937(-)
MKRALRLIYGSEGSASPDEIAPLLLSKDYQQSKTTLSNLSNQSMQSLKLLSCNEFNTVTEPFVKFSYNRYIPLTFVRSLLQLLDTEAISKLYCTSKSINLALASQSAPYPGSSMPVYCIDTIQLSEKIQQLDDSNDENFLLQKDARIASSPKPQPEFSNSPQNSRCGNNNSSIWKDLVGVGFVMFTFLFIFLYFHISILLCVVGLVILIVLYFVCKRQLCVERAVDCINGGDRIGYEAV